MTALQLDRDNWRLQAACRGHDPEMWSLTGGWHGQTYQAAHQICDSCPVQAQCLQMAVNTGSWGLIFGGQDFTKPSEARPPQWARCEQCLKTYQQQVSWSRHCSPNCRQRAYERERRMRRRP